MQTVGQILRNERESRNISIKEIEAATSIRALYINAIEEDNYSVVPGEVYLKGFIRNYANYLGLDGQQMVDHYRRSLQKAAEPAPAEPKTAEAAPVAPAASETAEPPVKKAARRKRKAYPSLTAVLLAVAVIAGGAWLMLPDNKQPANDPPAVKQTAPATPAKTPPASNAAVAQKPVVIVAKYTDRCWTSVTADGKQIFEGTPNAGETLTWEAQTNIDISVGDAGAINITYNGQSQGPLGARGAVLSKKFPPVTAKAAN